MRFRQYIASLFGLFLVSGLGLVLLIVARSKHLEIMTTLDTFYSFPTTVLCTNLQYRSTEPLKRDGSRFIHYTGPRLHALRRQPTARVRPPPSMLQTLAALGLLHYRGSRGGRRIVRSIQVLPRQEVGRGQPALKRHNPSPWASHITRCWTPQHVRWAQFRCSHGSALW